MNTDSFENRGIWIRRYLDTKVFEYEGIWIRRYLNEKVFEYRGILILRKFCKKYLNMWLKMYLKYLYLGFPCSNLMLCISDVFFMIEHSLDAHTQRLVFMRTRPFGKLGPYAPLPCLSENTSYDKTNTDNCSFTMIDTLWEQYCQILVNTSVLTSSVFT